MKSTLKNSAYPHYNRERYDLENGSSFVLYAEHVFYGFQQGALLTFYQNPNGQWYGDWNQGVEVKLLDRDGKIIQ